MNSPQRPSHVRIDGTDGELRSIAVSLIYTARMNTEGELVLGTFVAGCDARVEGRNDLSP